MPTPTDPRQFPLHPYSTLVSARHTPRAIPIAPLHGHVDQRVESIDVCAYGRIVGAKPLVSARQRPPQFPLHPYSRRRLARGGSLGAFQPSGPGSLGRPRSETSARGAFREKVDYSNLNRPRRWATSRVSL